MSEFTIEKNVPIPEGAEAGKSRASIYPWADMEPNDSVFIPAHVKHPRNVRSSIASFCKRHPNHKFVTRIRHEIGVEGTRIWRLPLETLGMVKETEIVAA